MENYELPNYYPDYSDPRADLYCVIYRTGSISNFEWHCTRAMHYTQAHVIKGDIRTMGYTAHVERYHLSLSVGLPETFAVGGGPLDPEDYIEAQDREEVLRCLRRMGNDEPQDQCEA